MTFLCLAASVCIFGQDETLPKASQNRPITEMEIAEQAFTIDPALKDDHESETFASSEKSSDLHIKIRSRNRRVLDEINTDWVIDISSETAIKTAENNNISQETSKLEDIDTPENTEEKFHWKPAIVQSLIFLGIQHGFRSTQERTRRELGGNFFKDWARSVKNLRGWADGDGAFVNYVAHPLQGALTGRIFVNNSDRAKKQEFGNSKEYWSSRLKALAWSTAWSVQFEIGPFSEASYGNVGLTKKNGHSPMSYVDLVITPTVGTAVLIGEDAIDKYVFKNWLEKGDSGKLKIKLLRCLFMPTTTFANILRGKAPWKRDGRPL